MPSVASSPQCKIRAALESHGAVVRVRNLQTTVLGPADAWGRPMKPQPMLVSASVTLRQSPDDTASDDALRGDAVNYGLLGKAIKASVERPEPGGQLSLDMVLARLWTDLCGTHQDGAREDGQQQAQGPIDSTVVAGLELTARLPKASLVGDGVSLATTAILEQPGTISGPRMHGRTLRLDSLKIPMIIGVNEHERKSSQLVLVSIQVDMLEHSSDIYTRLEAFIVEKASALSPKTLESLADTLTRLVSGHLTSHWHGDIPDPGPIITVMVEKPIAVPFADAPCFELTVNARDLYLKSART